VDKKFIAHIKRGDKFHGYEKASENVSKANLEPWITWLPRECEVKAEKNGVIHYCSSNCHYIHVLKEDRVYKAYGYHGFNLFKELTGERFEIDVQGRDSTDGRRT